MTLAMAIKKEKPVISEEEKKKRIKAFWISFAITFVVSVLIAVAAYFLSKGRFDSSEYEAKKYVIWTDTVSIPMVMLFLVWCLMKLTSYGAFDAISYSVQLAFLTIFHPNIRKSKLPATYREYREAKRGKKRYSIAYLLYACIPYLIATIVMLSLYFASK